LFCLCIYILGEKQPVIMFFILLTSAITLRTSIYGERVFEKFISSFRIIVTAQYITVVWIPVLIALFLQSVIHNKKFTKFTSTAVCMAIIITLFIFVTPIKTFTTILTFLEVLGAAITIYSIITIFLSKVQFKYIIAIGALVFGATGIHDMLYQSCIINGYAELSPVGFYVMLNVWAVILAEKYVMAIEDKEVLMQKALDAKIAFLQAQIKPHFLYNSLNTIAALCRIDEEEAENLTIELSKYLQYTFEFKNLSKFIAFNDELEFIKTYVKIEKARFGDEFEIIYDLCDTSELMVPPLSIQPLIENAIRHGLRKKGSFGIVTLKVYKKMTNYIIEVIDDGVGIQPELLEKIKSGANLNKNCVGFINVKFRIEQIYKTKLKIESKVAEGTRITIMVPMEVK
jgi:two-component system LytT family sensor kinase